MKKTPLIFFITSILLSGCGAGDSSPRGNPSPGGDASNSVNDSSTTTPTVFLDTIVPADFNWEMQHSELIYFKHVSNISQVDNLPISIPGEHYIEIYSIDENNVTSSTPFLKALTNRHGEAEVLLTLLNSWKGITVKTHLKDSVCINTLNKEQITTTQSLGCDVIIGSDF